MTDKKQKEAEPFITWLPSTMRKIPNLNIRPLTIQACLFVTDQKETRLEQGLHWSTLKKTEAGSGKGNDAMANMLGDIAQCRTTRAWNKSAFPRFDVIKLCRKNWCIKKFL